jgi:hypothetical protein
MTDTRFQPEGEYAHVPAAFINAIAEEGTKAEAIEYLQKQWNENCALRAELKVIRDVAVAPLNREQIARTIAEHMWCGATYDDATEAEKDAFVNAADAVLAALPSEAIGRELSDALRHEAIATVYQIVESYPRYALSQINDILAGEIVDAIAEIDDNRRNAHLNAGNIIAGSALSPPSEAIGRDDGKLIAALQSIAGWRKINLGAEYDHALRDIIRSITDCAEAALDASTLSRPHREGGQ